MVPLDITISDETVKALIGFADLLGVFSNAILGGLIGRKHKFDLVGFATLAIMSGLGGGMLRDTLLQAGPPVALTDPFYLMFGLIGAVVAFLVPVKQRVWDRIFPFIDAVALGSWAAAGAQKTLSLGYGWIPAVILGTITAVGGGVIRDVVLRRIPSVFGGNTLYATSAIVASGVMVLMQGNQALAMPAAILTGAAITLFATWRGWSLPEAYEWSPGAALRALPRPRWGKWHRAPDPDEVEEPTPPRRDDGQRRQAEMD